MRRPLFLVGFIAVSLLVVPHVNAPVYSCMECVNCPDDAGKPWCASIPGAHHPDAPAKEGETRTSREATNDTILNPPSSGAGGGGGEQAPAPASPASQPAPAAAQQVSLPATPTSPTSPPSGGAKCDGWADSGSEHRNAGNGCFYVCSNGIWTGPTRCDGQGNGQFQGEAAKTQEERARQAAEVAKRQAEAEAKVKEQGAAATTEVAAQTEAQRAAEANRQAEMAQNQYNAAVAEAESVRASDPARADQILAQAQKTAQEVQAAIAKSITLTQTTASAQPTQAPTSAPDASVDRGGTCSGVPFGQCNAGYRCTGACNGYNCFKADPTCPGWTIGENNDVTFRGGSGCGAGNVGKTSPGTDGRQFVCTRAGVWAACGQQDCEATLAKVEQLIDALKTNEIRAVEAIKKEFPVSAAVQGALKRVAQSDSRIEAVYVAQSAYDEASTTLRELQSQANRARLDGGKEIPEAIAQKIREAQAAVTRAQSALNAAKLSASADEERAAADMIASDRRVRNALVAYDGILASTVSRMGRSASPDRIVEEAERTFRNTILAPLAQEERERVIRAQERGRQQQAAFLILSAPPQARQDYCKQIAARLGQDAQTQEEEQRAVQRATNECSASPERATAWIIGNRIDPQYIQEAKQTVEAGEVSRGVRRYQDNLDACLRGGRPREDCEKTASDQAIAAVADPKAKNQLQAAIVGVNWQDRAFRVASQPDSAVRDACRAALLGREGKDPAVCDAAAPEAVRAAFLADLADPASIEKAIQNARQANQSEELREAAGKDPAVRAALGELQTWIPQCLEARAQGRQSDVACAKVSDAINSVGTQYRAIMVEAASAISKDARVALGVKYAAAQNALTLGTSFGSFQGSDPRGSQLEATYNRLGLTQEQQNEVRTIVEYVRRQDRYAEKLRECIQRQTAECWEKADDLFRAAAELSTEQRDANANLYRETVRSSRQRQAYQQYKRDHPNATFDAYERAEEAALARIHGELALNGEWEAFLAQYQSGEVSALAKEREMNQGRRFGTSMIGSWLSQAVNWVKEGALGQWDKRRAAEHLLVQDTTNIVSSLRDFLQSDTYKTHCAGKPASKCQYEAVTAMVDQQWKLEATGDLPAQRRNAYIGRVLRGDIDAFALKEQKKDVNILWAAFNQITNQWATYSTFPGFNSEQELAARRDKLFAFDWEGMPAEERVAILEAVSRSPAYTTSGFSSPEDFLKERYRKATAFTEAAKHGDFAPATGDAAVLFADDPQWLHRAALRGSVDMDKLADDLHQAEVTARNTIDRSACIGQSDTCLYELIRKRAAELQAEIIAAAWQQSLDESARQRYAGIDLNVQRAQVARLIANERDFSSLRIAPSFTDVATGRYDMVAAAKQYERAQQHWLAGPLLSVNKALGGAAYDGSMAIKNAVDYFSASYHPNQRLLEHIGNPWVDVPRDVINTAYLNPRTLFWDLPSALIDNPFSARDDQTLADDRAAARKYVGGALKLGAKPATAAVVLAAPFAAPFYFAAVPVMAATTVAVAGTGFGVANTVGSLEHVADACLLAQHVDSAECGLAAGTTAYFAATTGLGAISGQQQLLAAAVSKAAAGTVDDALLAPLSRIGPRQAVAISRWLGQATAFAEHQQLVGAANTAVSAGGALLFGAQAAETCGKTGMTYDCLTSAGFAAVSGLRFAQGVPFIGGALKTGLTSLEVGILASQVGVSCGAALEGNAPADGCLQTLGFLTQTLSHLPVEREQRLARLQQLREWGAPGASEPETLAQMLAARDQSLARLNELFDPSGRPVETTTDAARARAQAAARYIEATSRTYGEQLAMRRFLASVDRQTASTAVGRELLRLQQEAKEFFDPKTGALKPDVDVTQAQRIRDGLEFAFNAAQTARLDLAATRSMRNVAGRDALVQLVRTLNGETFDFTKAHDRAAYRAAYNKARDALILAQEAIEKPAYTSRQSKLSEEIARLREARASAEARARILEEQLAVLEGAPDATNEARDALKERAQQLRQQADRALENGELAAWAVFRGQVSAIERALEAGSDTAQFQELLAQTRAAYNRRIAEVDRINGDISALVAQRREAGGPVNRAIEAVGSLGRIVSPATIARGAVNLVADGYSGLLDRLGLGAWRQTLREAIAVRRSVSAELPVSLARRIVDSIALTLLGKPSGEVSLEAGTVADEYRAVKRSDAAMQAIRESQQMREEAIRSLFDSSNGKMTLVAQSAWEGAPPQDQRTKASMAEFVAQAERKFAKTRETYEAAQARFEMERSEANRSALVAADEALKRAHIDVLKARKQELLFDQFERARKSGKESRAQQLLAAIEKLPAFPPSWTDQQKLTVELRLRALESRINEVWKQTGRIESTGIFSWRDAQLKDAFAMLSGNRELAIQPTGGGKTLTNALYLDLSFALQVRNGVYIAKEAQSPQVAGVLKPLFGDDLFYFRHGRDAKGEPIDIIVQEAQLRNAKFILTEPSDVAFLVDTMRSPGVTDAQRLAAFRVFEKVYLAANRVIDEFPEFLNTRNEWVMSFAGDAVVRASEAQRRVVELLYEALKDPRIAVLREGMRGSQQRVSLGEIIARSSGSVELPHFTEEGIRLVVEKLVEKGLFSGKTTDDVIGILMALSESDAAKLADIQKKIEANTAERDVYAEAVLVADAMNKTARILSSEIGRDTFETGIGARGNLQENVRDGDIMSALARRMLQSHVWERPLDLETVWVNGQTIRTNLFDLYALDISYANETGRDQVGAISGVTATPDRIRTLATLFGYRMDEAMVDRINADNRARIFGGTNSSGERVVGRVRPGENFESLGEGATLEEALRRYAELMPEKLKTAENIDNKHILAIHARAEKGEVLRLLLNEQNGAALRSIRNFVVADERGNIHRLDLARFNRSGEVAFEPFEHRIADRNLSTRQSAIERLLEIGVPNDTLVIILEGQSIGANFPANKDVSFASIVDARSAELEGAYQTHGRGKRVEGQTLIFDGMIVFGSRQGTSKEALDAFIRRLEVNTRAAQKDLMTQAIPGWLTAEAAMPLYKAFISAMRSNDLEGAATIAQMLGDMQKTSRSYEAKLYGKTGTAFADALKDQVAQLSAQYLMLVEKYKRFFEARQELRTAVEKNILKTNDRSLSIQESGGDPANLGLRGDGLSGAVDRIGRYLSYDYVNRQTAPEASSPLLVETKSLLEAVEGARGEPVAGVDPVSTALMLSRENAEAQLAEAFAAEEEAAIAAAQPAAPAAPAGAGADGERAPHQIVGGEPGGPIVDDYRAAYAARAAAAANLAVAQARNQPRRSQPPTRLADLKRVVGTDEDDSIVQSRLESIQSLGTTPFAMNPEDLDRYKGWVREAQNEGELAYRILTEWNTADRENYFENDEKVRQANFYAQEAWKDVAQQDVQEAERQQEAVEQAIRADVAERLASAIPGVTAAEIQADAALVNAVVSYEQKAVVAPENVEVERQAAEIAIRAFADDKRRATPTFSLGTDAGQPNTPERILSQVSGPLIAAAQSARPATSRAERAPAAPRPTGGDLAWWERAGNAFFNAVAWTADTRNLVGAVTTHREFRKDDGLGNFWSILNLAPAGTGLTQQRVSKEISRREAVGHTAGYLVTRGAALIVSPWIGVPLLTYDGFRLLRHVVLAPRGKITEPIRLAATAFRWGSSRGPSSDSPVASAPHVTLEASRPGSDVFPRSAREMRDYLRARLGEAWQWLNTTATDEELAGFGIDAKRERVTRVGTKLASRGRIGAWVNAVPLGLGRGGIFISRANLRYGVSRAGIAETTRWLLTRVVPAVVFPPYAIVASAAERMRALVWIADRVIEMRVAQPADTAALRVVEVRAADDEPFAEGKEVIARVSVRGGAPTEVKARLVRTSLKTNDGKVQWNVIGLEGQYKDLFLITVPQDAIIPPR